jgi:homocysteine S-methyltransferase
VPTPDRDGLARLLAEGPCALDGGLAWELTARGHHLDDALWSARLLADSPQALRDVHLAYFRAGARVATSASYQASRQGFAAAGIDGRRADRLLASSVTLAAQARDVAVSEGVPGPLLVAASVGPYGAVRHDGSEYTGRYGLSRAELVDFHGPRVQVLLDAGPDLLAVETIPDVAEVEALAEVLAAVGGPPAWVSFTCCDEGHTCAGDAFADAVALAAAMPGVLAVGVNCTAPRHVGALLRLARLATDLPLVVYPNAGGTWDAATGEWDGATTHVLSATLVQEWVTAGARLVGGCCGLGPDAVTGIASALGPGTGLTET